MLEGILLFCGFLFVTNAQVLCTLSPSFDWETWQGEVTTLTPVYFPVSDTDIACLLDYAANNGMTVRVGGAGHSEAGVVMNRLEENVLVMHLQQHVTSQSGWTDSIDDGTGLARFGCGRSFLDFMQLVRVEGWLMFAHTMSYHFSVCGVIANSAHGAIQLDASGNLPASAYDTGFVFDQVTAMLVMEDDGTISEITGTDLQYWRCSFGLLGVILAVEIQLMADPGIAMENPTTSYDMGQSTVLDDIVTEQCSIAESGKAQFFFDFYGGTLLARNVKVLGPPFDGTGPNRAIYEAGYSSLQTTYPDISVNGGVNFEFDPCDQGVPDCTNPEAVAHAVTGFLIQALSNAGSNGVIDGFLTPLLTNFNTIIVTAPATFFRRVFATWIEVLEIWSTAPSDYFPFGGCEWRYISPTPSTAVLNPIPSYADFAAQWATDNPSSPTMPEQDCGVNGVVVFEVVSLKGLYSDNYSQYFDELQTAFETIRSDPLDDTSPFVPVKLVHHGKGYAYGTNSDTTPNDGQYRPFTDSSRLSDVYTSSIVNSFNAERATLDPNNLFAGGHLLEWLDTNNYEAGHFEPRFLNTQTCELGEHFMCVGGHCDQGFCDDSPAIIDYFWEDVTTSGLSLSAELASTGAMLWWCLLEDGVTAPADETELQTCANNPGVGNVAGGSLVFSSVVEIIAVANSLTSNTAYSLYFLSSDAVPEVFSSIHQLDGTTLASSSISGDPHFVGFHGQRYDIVHTADRKFSGSYMNIFCLPDEVNMYARLAENAGGSLFMDAAVFVFPDSFVKFDENGIHEHGEPQLHASYHHQMESNQDINMQLDTLRVNFNLNMLFGSYEDRSLDFEINPSAEVTEAFGYIGRTLASSVQELYDYEHFLAQEFSFECTR